MSIGLNIIGSGSEQAILMPTIHKAAPAHTLITADAGYFSDNIVLARDDQGIPAQIANNGMRQTD